MTCTTYGATTPILSVSWAHLWLDISLAEREAPVSDQAMRFARDLAQAAAEFAAEAERLHALSHPQPAGNTAA